MKRYVILVAIAAVALFPALLLADSAFPFMSTVNHSAVNPGQSLIITGTNLDAENVASVFLTNGAEDCELVINSQTKTAIAVTIPRGTKIGRFALMILTRGETPRLIEEPVKVTVK